MDLEAQSILAELCAIPIGEGEPGASAHAPRLKHTLHGDRQLVATHPWRHTRLHLLPGLQSHVHSQGGEQEPDGRLLALPRPQRVHTHLLRDHVRVACLRRRGSALTRHGRARQGRAQRNSLASVGQRAQGQLAAPETSRSFAHNCRADSAEHFARCLVGICQEHHDCPVLLVQQFDQLAYFGLVLAGRVQPVLERLWRHARLLLQSSRKLLCRFRQSACGSRAITRVHARYSSMR